MYRKNNFADILEENSDDDKEEKKEDKKGDKKVE